MTRLFLEELARIQERLQELFEPALLPAGYRGGEKDAGALPGGWSPPVDLVETEEAYLLCAELPGVRREDVNLRITGRSLELSGCSPPLPGGHQFLRMERSHGGFHRTFELGGPVDAERISARLTDGILTVSVPKRSEGQGAPASGEAAGGEGGEG